MLDYSIKIEKRADSLINLAKNVSKSSLAGFIDNYPNIKKLINNEKGSESWDFFMTIAGIHAAFLHVNQDWILNYIKVFEDCLENSMLKWHPDANDAYTDLNNYIQKSKKKDIQYETVLGSWIMLNLKGTDPNEEETKIANIIGDILVDSVLDWWETT